MTFKTKAFAAFMLVLVLTVGIFTGSIINGQNDSAKALAAEDSNKRTISVSGEGVIKVSPDVAYITLGVETSDKEMTVAQKANRDKMNDIIDELHRLGIKDEDIQTQNYSVFPDYQWQENKSVLVGYRVSNQVRVRISDIDDTGRVLDSVADKGANIVNSIQFTVSDAKEAYNQALELALKDAEDKAKLMVGYFGFKNVAPITITEGSQGYPSVWRDVVDMAELAPRGTPISGGQMEIRASVNVTFKY
jgi:uncharacterized protein YggE